MNKNVLNVVTLIELNLNFDQLAFSIIMFSQSKLQKEWRTGGGESDWEMISQGNKNIFWKEVKRVWKR